MNGDKKRENGFILIGLAIVLLGLFTLGGPEDTRVSSAVLNFSRVILLRDEMRAHGDTAKPVWAVEMGWNALEKFRV